MIVASCFSFGRERQRAWLMSKLFRRWCGRRDWAPRTMLLCRMPCCRSWPSASRGTTAQLSLYAQLSCRSRLFTDCLPCLAGITEVSLP